MNFIQKLFGWRGKPDNVFYETLEDAEVPSINHTSKLKGAASNAVDKIAKACATTEPMSIDEKKPIDTTANLLLDKPNQRMNGDQLIYKVVEDIYKGGWSAVVLIGNVKSKATEMYYVKPTKISLFVNVKGIIERYTVLNDDYQGIYILQDDGRFLNEENPFLELVIVEYPNRLSILDSIKEEIEALRIGVMRNTSLVRNGGRMSTLLAFKNYVDQDEMQARIESIRNAITKKNYGAILGVNSGENGVDVKEMGLSPKDMDFLQFQEWCRREVYFRCGVPIPLIDNKAATDNNMKWAKLQLYTETVVPLCDIIYGKIGNAIAARENKNYKTVTNQMAIPSIRDSVITDLETRTKINVETKNELRASMGLDPIQGGDQLFIEARMVPIDQQNQANLG